MPVYFGREADDIVADARISIGSPKGSDDFYFVFRGDPKKVLALLERAVQIARKKLPDGDYEDKRIQR